MKAIQLTNGYIALVDDDDFDYLNKWKWQAIKCKGGYVYATRGFYKEKGKVRKIMMHREIMKTPKGMVCDHSDHNTLNNQKSNLRNCSYSNNSMNKTSQKGSSSKYLGVHVNKQKYKGKVYSYWRAQIMVDKKKVTIGSFKSELEAAAAYDCMANKYFGDFANKNLRYA